MTFGEMRRWTERFNQIIGAAQCLKDRRLSALKNDLEQTYPGLQNTHARHMHVTVLEAMEGTEQEKRHVG